LYNAKGGEVTTTDDIASARSGDQQGWAASLLKKALR
jgi:hypothetical protein